MTSRQEAHAWIDYCRALLRGETPAPPENYDPDRLHLLDQLRDEETAGWP